MKNKSVTFFVIGVSGSVSIKKLGAITVGWKLDLAGRVGNWGNANAVRDRYNQQRSDICREMQEYCTPPSTPSW